MASADVTTSTFGLVNGRPLFLDLAADSYFLLPPAEEQAFLAAIEAGRTDAPRPVQCPSPQGSVLDAANPPVLARDIFACWRHLRLARRQLRRGGLDGAIASLGGTRNWRRSDEQRAAEELSRRFCAARKWIPRAPDCLLDSLALLGFLRANGAGANLVFAAKLDPFAAHCWLQRGAVLLNDRPDRVESFTPVCVLGA